MAQLSSAEIGQYRDQGYLIPGFRLAASKVERLRQSLERLILDNPDVRPEKLVSAHVVGADGGKNAEGVRGHQDFLDLAMDPDLLDLVEQVIGPDIILWGCHVFCKPAGDGMETPWHQDGQYWPIRPLANCTVWVAAGVTHPHLVEDRQDLVLNLRTVEDVFDAHQAVDLELQPGQMSMHDVHMIHGARVNRSNKRRAGVALRYLPGSSVFERAINPTDGKSGVPVAFATRPLWLLRGQDRTGRNDFKAGFPV
jgi:hypothetical protein